MPCISLITVDRDSLSTPRQSPADAWEPPGRLCFAPMQRLCQQVGSLAYSVPRSGPNGYRCGLAVAWRPLGCAFAFPSSPPKRYQGKAGRLLRTESESLASSLQVT